jgi:hypothetical protein
LGQCVVTVPRGQRFGAAGERRRLTADHKACALPGHQTLETGGRRRSMRIDGSEV